MDLQFQILIIIVGWNFWVYELAFGMNAVIFLNILLAGTIYPACGDDERDIRDIPPVPHSMYRSGRNRPRFGHVTYRWLGQS